MDFVAGCIGGAAGCAASHPFDTVKVKLQVCAHSEQGVIRCFQQILRAEGLTGLYRGLTSPLYTVAAINAVCFGTYSAALRRRENVDSLWSHAVAGAASGLAIAPLLCPMELAKNRLQTVGDAVTSKRLRGSTVSVMKYRGPMDCLIKIYRSEGVAGLSRGMVGTVVREVPAIAAYFPAYEGLKRCYTQYNGGPQCPTWWLFLAGGVAGCVSWAVTYPVDVIKSRIQCDGMRMKRIGGRPHYQYTGYLDCLKKSINRDGAGMLLRGMPAAMFRAFPNNGVCLMTVALVHDLHRRYVGAESLGDISVPLQTEL